MVVARGVDGKGAADMPEATPEERFWDKVNKHGPVPERRPDLGRCWIWNGTKGRAGHGQFNVDGRHVSAYRFAWELLVGPIPEGYEPDHLCRVPPCVKPIADEFGPAHLEPVTRQENQLRGEGVGGRNARKTHCIHGHPFDEVNTIWRPSGGRDCHQCKREGALRYGQQHREERRQAARRHYEQNREQIRARQNARRARKRAERS
jgi:hypothetical protein